MTECEPWSTHQAHQVAVLTVWAETEKLEPTARLYDPAGNHVEIVEWL